MHAGGLAALVRVGDWGSGWCGTKQRFDSFGVNIFDNPTLRCLFSIINSILGLPARTAVLHSF
jgi:hypothetical protein